ncbi:hypothetical protein [Anabaena sp. CCY 9910]|uniref:hypothetical protein n=1 Tax=Anabaena sp. CCY 9910 TaxID=3103870 RepID=UPI0039E19E6E
MPKLDVLIITASEESRVSQPENAYELLKEFEKHLNQEHPNQSYSIFNQSETSVYRYTLPGWGSPSIQGKKITQAEKIAAQEFAKKISLKEFQNALKIQQKVFDDLKIPKSIQRNYRAILNRIIQFSQKYVVLQNESATQSQTSTAHHPLWRKGRNADKVKTTNKQWQPRFGLGCIPGDMVSDVLEKQLLDLEDFGIDILGMRATTAKLNTSRIKQILGAEPCRQCVASTVKLNINTLIPFVPIRTGLRTLPIDSSLAQRLIQQEELKEQARQAAIKCQSDIKRLLRWYREERKVSPGMEQGVILVYIFVAKFLYRNETDKLQAEDYEDIPVIIMLRQLLREVIKRVDTATPAIDVEKKWLDWPEWLSLVETLRQEATVVVYVRPGREQPSGLRVLRGIGQSLQIFLLCSFWAFLPPDRQRTVRELEEGKSLVWKDDKWQIHLTSGATKIDNEEEWIPIPNVKFQDGTCLYQYFQAWLHDYKALPSYANLPWEGGLRAVFAPEHSFCFTMVDSGKPLTANAVRDYVKRRAYRLTKKAITPHLTRSMYITYLEENGVPENLMVSTAKSMHHSRATQRKHYDKRQQSKKMQPGLDLAVQVAQSILHK